MDSNSGPLYYETAVLEKNCLTTISPMFSKYSNLHQVIVVKDRIWLGQKVVWHHDSEIKRIIETKKFIDLESYLTQFHLKKLLKGLFF